MSEEKLTDPIVSMVSAAVENTKLTDRLAVAEDRIRHLERAIQAMYSGAFLGPLYPSAVAGLMDAYAGQFGYRVNLEDRRACKACHGNGVVERCCGQGFSGDYWNPPECCGQMCRDDCPECKATGVAVVEQEADDIQF